MALGVNLLELGINQSMDNSIIITGGFDIDLSVHWLVVGCSTQRTVCLGK